MLACILKFGLVGCLVFTGFVVIMSKTGIAAAMRDENGTFRKNLNWKMLTGALAFILFLLSLLLTGSYCLAQSTAQTPGFVQFFGTVFGVFMVVHLYDLLVLDYIIVVRWHPAFLKLPDTEYYTSFTPHLIGFFRGLPMGVLASLIVSLISVFVF